MENMNEAIARAKELIAIADKRKWDIEEALKEAESGKAKALQAVESFSKEGDINKIKSAKAEADAFEERIRYLKSQSEEMNFEDLEEDIEELQAFARAYAKQKQAETGDIYYNAWVEGERAELEAEHAINNANWIITQTDRILKRNSNNSIGGNIFKGMLEGSKKEIQFVEVWSRFYQRRREEYLK